MYALQLCFLRSGIARPSERSSLAAIRCRKVKQGKRGHRTAAQKKRKAVKLSKVSCVQQELCYITFPLQSCANC